MAATTNLDQEVRPTTGGTADMSQPDRPLSTVSSEQNPFDTGANTPMPELSRPNSSSALQSLGPNPSQLSRQLSTASTKRKSSYTPVIPSPLNNSSSQSSVVEGRSGIPTNSDTVSARNSHSSGEEQSRSVNNNSTPIKSKRNTVGISPPQQILRQKSAQALRPVSSGTETPRALKDLGRDYSRYPASNTNLASISRPSLLNASAGASEVALLRTTTKNPFSDSQADLEKWGYPDDSLGAFDPYHGGEKGFILYSNELEEDDRIHMPADDDDETFKTKWSDLFGRRQIVNTIGGIVFVLGVLSLFIALPVLSFGTHYLYPTDKGSFDPNDFGPAWAHVNNRTYPALKNIRRTLIDPATPMSARTRPSTFDTTELNLVFSDEFNEPGRTFYPEDDPYWHGADLWYGATQDFEWYDPDAITTANGTLQLRLDSFPNHGLQYRSGMLNSWNQMCFKGGIMEVSVSLAGPSGIPGLWPGVWSMGNLGRPGFKATTEGVWPYTYDGCDAGITPNQSDSTGLSGLPGQKLASCVCDGEDHPTPGTGRGAPELDVLEASVDPINRIGVVTQSLQVAPFDNLYRPNSDFMAMPDYNTTQMNGYCGGPFQQAVSATTLLNNGWYDGLAYQKYAFEYVPGSAPTGKIAWFVGENPSFIMDSRAIGENGNVGARQVPMEPMSMILNLGYSASWTQIDSANLKFPTIMHIDYVRIYQKEGEESVTCDPPGYPTTQYIKDHPLAYRNPNVTVSDLQHIAFSQQLIQF
jgi:beta-glucanase (GH16 family)